MTIYHGDQALAERITAQMTHHYMADQVVQGTYAKGAGDTFRGCFIGCIAHSDNVAEVERLTGLPPMLTRIAESIFEGLPADEARQFFADMRDCMARNIGKDVSLVAWQFLHSIVKRALDRPESEVVREACQPALDVLSAKARGEVISTQAAADAAADAAANAAADAADAADAAARADLIHAITNSCPLDNPNGDHSEKYPACQ